MSQLWQYEHTRIESLHTRTRTRHLQRALTIDGLIHLCICIYTYMIYMYTFHVYIHIYIYIYMYIHTYTDSYIVYTYTCIHRCTHHSWARSSNQPTTGVCPKNNVTSKKHTNPVNTHTHTFNSTSQESHPSSLLSLYCFTANTITSHLL